MTTLSDDLIKEGTDRSFMVDVIEASRTQPVIVDFWAPWCGPCRTLTPTLERAVTAAGGKVKLVKINIDKEQQIAGRLGVQSIPAVFAFDKGQPVDGFMGALPEREVNVFIGRITGEGEKVDVTNLLKDAAEALALNDPATAGQIYGEILQIQPDNVKALAGLARCYVLGDDIERAGDILAMVPEDKASDPDVQSVRAAIKLKSLGAGLDTSALDARLKANPDDHDARLQLAEAFAGAGKLEQAVDQLLDLFTRDREWNEQAARKRLLEIFDAAGPTSDLAKQGRRRLSALHFS